MIKVRCDEIGNCPLADGQVHEMESIEAHPCPLRTEYGRCGLKEVRPESIDWRKWLIIGVIVVGVIVLLGGAVYLVREYFSTPTCKVADVRSLMSLDPKVGELEEAGLDCLESGKARAEADHLVVGIAALRLADDKGSAPAAAALGRLFDPTVRKELEEESEQPGLLPAPDPALAIRFYDRAAKRGDAEAAKAAARLRSQSSLPPADGRQVGRGGAPINVPGYGDIYQRVLAKPGAVLVGSPGAGGGQPVQTFAIYYVFSSQPGWLRVGRSLEPGAEGWIAEDKTQNFNAMLAMRYTPPGQRGPVLFFKDEMSVRALLMQPGAAEEVGELVRSTASGTPDPRLVAVEDRSIDWASSKYVMPILRTVQITSDDGRTIYLANVASVSSGVSAGVPSYCSDRSIQSMRHQIMFVIDTTISMGPYIEGVRRIAAAWKSEIERRGLTDKFRFGVVAYRNNMDAPAQARLDYVTRTALPLSATSDANAFVAAMAGLSPAPVSTHSFDEDAVAGLHEALGSDWSGCGLRLMFLITDAGSLSSEDPKARHQGVGLSTIAARANDLNIRIFPIHIATREARQAGNIEKAAAQYREAFASQSGSKAAYYAISDGSPRAFTAYIDQVRSVIDRVADERRGIAIVGRPAAAGGGGNLKQQVLTELFSVQQQFLGASAGAQAPTFTDSWTSDTDLANPDRKALEVVVLLTRRQLNQLAEQTDRLVRTARQANMDTARFFNLLRMVSAATAQDPQRFNEVTRVGAMMPSFLRLLPYRSDVLNLTAEDWRGMGAGNQDRFIQKLRAKFEYYQSVNNSMQENVWVDLAGGSRDDQVTRIPLSEMP
jgi:serine/threonine-protein kinase PpkA